MKRSKLNWLVPCWILLGALLLVGSQAKAQAPPHAGYIHAINDLRAARAQLMAPFQNPNHIQAAHAAIDEINHAIGDLKQAAAMNGADGNDTIPPNSQSDAAGRFHKANQYLTSARVDASAPESDPAALRSRDDGVRRIDAAIAIVRKAIGE
jgi:hypothetical protein